MIKGSDHNSRWFEAIPPEERYPRDLHAAQLARRLAGYPDKAVGHDRK